MSDIEEIQTTGASDLTLADMKEMASESEQKVADDIATASKESAVDPVKISECIRDSVAELEYHTQEHLMSSGMTISIVDKDGVSRPPDLTNPDDVKMLQEQRLIGVSKGESYKSEWEIEHNSVDSMRVKATELPEGHVKMFPLHGGAKMSETAMYSLLHTECVKITGIVSIARPKLLHLLYPIRLPPVMSSFTVMCMYSAAIRVLASPAIVPKAMETAVNALSSNPDTVLTPEQFDAIVSCFVPSKLPLVSNVGLVQPDDFQKILIALPREQKTMAKLSESLSVFNRPSFQGVNRAIFKLGIPYLDVYKDSGFFEDMTGTMNAEYGLEQRLVLARIVGRLDTEVGAWIRNSFAEFMGSNLEDRFISLADGFTPTVVPGRTEIDLDEMELVMRGSVIHSLHTYERCIMNLLFIMPVREVNIPLEQRGDLMTPMSFPPVDLMPEESQRDLITMARHNMSQAAYVNGITDMFIMARDAFSAPQNPELEEDGSFDADNAFTVSMGVALQGNETNSLLVPVTSTLAITTGNDEVDSHYYDEVQSAIDSVKDRRDRIDEAKHGFLAEGHEPSVADQKAADLINPDRSPPPPRALAAAWPPVLRKAMADIFMAAANDVINPAQTRPGIARRMEILRKGMHVSNIAYIAVGLAAQLRRYMENTHNEAERVASACKELGYSAEDLLKGGRSTGVGIIEEQLGIATGILGLKVGDPMFVKIMANVPEEERPEIEAAVSDTSTFFRMKAAAIIGEGAAKSTASKRGRDSDVDDTQEESAEGTAPEQDTGDIEL